jgi:hypothetical protein
MWSKSDDSWDSSVCQVKDTHTQVNSLTKVDEGLVECECQLPDDEQGSVHVAALCDSSVVWGDLTHVIILGCFCLVLCGVAVYFVYLNSSSRTHVRSQLALITTIGTCKAWEALFYFVIFDSNITSLHAVTVWLVTGRLSQMMMCWLILSLGAAMLRVENSDALLKQVYWPLIGSTAIVHITLTGLAISIVVLDDLDVQIILVTIAQYLAPVYYVCFTAVLAYIVLKVRYFPTFETFFIDDAIIRLAAGLLILFGVRNLMQLITDIIVLKGSYFTIITGIEQSIDCFLLLLTLVFTISVEWESMHEDQTKRLSSHGSFGDIRSSGVSGRANFVAKQMRMVRQRNSSTNDELEAHQQKV